jgi:peptide/nickel transport system substrate-binding protein
MPDRPSGGFPMQGRNVSRRNFLTATAGGVLVVGAGGALVGCSSSSSPATTPAAGGGSPKRGGHLRVGLSSGSPSDTLDPNHVASSMDVSRAEQLFDSLTIYDRNGKVQLSLADEMTPNSDASVWTIRVRKGVTFHNGKPLTADDVMHSFFNIVDPKAPGSFAAALAGLDIAGMKKVDTLTAQIPFHAPLASLPDLLAAYTTFVIPVGFDPKNPVGTGPFKYQSFTPGTSSTFVRNSHYWQAGLPYVDSVTINDFPDPTSQLNAFQSGQIDLISLPSSASVSQVVSSGGAVVKSQSGSSVPFVMYTAQAPFTDVRVRQAFRLMVDRNQINEVVYGGTGLIGNDVFGRFDPAYDSALPQRQQDIAQAKFLLKKAGHEDLSIQITTADIGPGATLLAQVFKQQASAAGVKVGITTSADFYGKDWLSYLFTQDYWFTQSYLAQVAQTTLPHSPYWETHFDDPQFTQLYAKAERTTDPAARRGIEQDMMRIDYDSGGYIVPCFVPSYDAHSARVHGVKPSRLGIPFNNSDFKSLWID